MASLHVIVLAAGEGKRLKGRQPKMLTPIWGRPAICWPVQAAAALEPDTTVVVGGAHLEALEAALAGEAVRLACQPEPLGTGHAALCAEEALAGAAGSVLILNGDGPLVHPEMIARLVEHHREAGAQVSLLTVRVDDPSGYGRVLRDADGSVTGIVEEKDAAPDERAVREINSGMWLVEAPAVFERLRQLGTDNAQGEVYLTDLVGLTLAAGGKVAALEWDDPADALGFNDQVELAVVRSLLRWRILTEHMAAGVEIMDPDTTYIDASVEIEPGARILPCTVIEGRVSIATGCEVGPFTHLRDGTTLEPGAEVGNFTETKKTVLGAGCKAKHLTYLGDTRIGAGTNIGAGTITANYDGRHKHQTTIGERAFIGSGTVIVAPSVVGDEATTGAGAIVTRNSDVGRGEVWVGVPARPLPKTSEPEDEPKEAHS